MGPCTDKIGPCLVLYSGCTLSPGELNSWIYSGTSSSAAVVRSYWLGASPHEASSHEDLVAQLRAAGPPPDGGGVRLQCAPRTLEGWLAERLGPAFNLQPVNPQWVLNVVCMAADGSEGEGDEAASEAAQQGAAPPEGGQQQQQQQSAETASAAGQEQRGEHCRQQRVLYSLLPASSLYNYSPVKDKRIPDQLSKAAGGLGGTPRGSAKASARGWCGGRAGAPSSRRSLCAPSSPLSRVGVGAQPVPLRLPALVTPLTMPDLFLSCRQAGRGAAGVWAQAH